MKICPLCQRTYSDDSLNYCLDDGSVLTFTSPSREAETVLMGRPGPTNIGQPITTAFPSVASTTPFETHPHGKSRAWLWGILILGGLMLLCGGGLGGIFWIASERNNENSDLKIQDPIVKKDESTDKDATVDLWEADQDERQMKLTIEKFRQLKNGMSYKEVVAILGNEGTVLQDTSGGGVESATYQWMGDNFETIILTFQNDKLNSKTQVGLEPSNDSDTQKLITREKYDRLKDGMTYKQVVGILGGEGQEQFNSNIAGFSMATYQWKGSGYSQIIITFQNDKLQSKSQVGL